MVKRYPNRINYKINFPIIKRKSFEVNFWKRFYSQLHSSPCLINFIATFINLYLEWVHFIPFSEVFCSNLNRLFQKSNYFWVSFIIVQILLFVFYYSWVKMSSYFNCWSNSFSYWLYLPIQVGWLCGKVLAVNINEHDYYLQINPQVFGKALSE